MNDDLISRVAAIDAICDNCDAVKASCPHYPCGRYKALEKLPSAQPERKTGWWLIREGISDAQCSKCKMYFRDVYDMENSDAFCRHCGAKMEGLKVVEDE